MQFGKPNPEGYLKSLKTLQVTAAEAFMIEDSPAGVVAAQSAGIQVIQYGSDIDRKSSQTDYYVSTANEIKKIINTY